MTPFVLTLYIASATHNLFAQTTYIVQARLSLKHTPLRSQESGGANMNNAQVINSHSSPGGVQDTLLNESLYVVFAIGFWVLGFGFLLWCCTDISRDGRYDTTIIDTTDTDTSS